MKGFCNFILSLFYNTHKNVASVGNRLVRNKKYLKNCLFKSARNNFLIIEKVFNKSVHAVSVDNIFLGFGKGLDSFVVLTKAFFSVEHKSRSDTPSL